MHFIFRKAEIFKYSLLSSVLSALFLLGSGADQLAKADDSFLSNYYIEGRIGGALTDSFDSTMVSPNVAAANGNLSIDLDDGFGFEVAIGRYFSSHWRADLAFTFGQADDIAIDYSGAPANPLSAGPQPVASNGDITVFSFLLNVYRVFDTRIWRAQPFVGAGIGFTNIDLDNVAPPGSRFVISDDDTVFTFVHHLGFDVPVSHGIDLTLRYSGIISSDSSFRAIDTGMGPGILDVHSDGEYIPAVSAGVRVKLN